MLPERDKMLIHISDEARRATTDCKKGFSCLKAARNGVCPVERCVGGKVHFIKCLSNGYCSYRRPFGYGFFCSCPVRKELFNKYQI